MKKRQGKRPKQTLDQSHPELLAIWDYEKNTVKPKEVSFGSGIKVWWKCQDNTEHSYSLSPKEMLNRKSGCPQCILTLDQSHPELLEIWDYEKNSIKPSEITRGSKIKVWWKCPINAEHSYDMAPLKKTIDKQGCPYCSHRRLSDLNSLAINHPWILDEWDYELNIIDPNDIAYSSHKEVWLKCQNGIHASYLTSPNKRISCNLRCQDCFGQVNRELLALSDERLDMDDRTGYLLPYLVSQKRHVIKTRNRTISLSNLEIGRLLLLPCQYCTRYFSGRMTMDRVDNDLEYVQGNCVSCCWFCNSAKSNFTITQFKEWIVRAYHNERLGDKSTSHIRYDKCMKNATDRDIPFLLSREQFTSIVSEPCYYCGYIERVGVDRYQNDQGYSIDNCVPACRTCNCGKLTQTPEDFRQMIELLYANINNF